jgi:uncharacterized protein (TIGR04222 family)
MTPKQTELYRKIQEFEIDEGQPSFPFEARLAKENSWSRPFSRRVIQEYKRFAFLAMTAPHSVTPSEQVDQAWHMHLTFTKSYWLRFCEVLGQPLHHNPTQGGADETQKYRKLYQQTLLTYREMFNEDAPADIWPSVDDRFGKDLQVERINTAENWVLPKKYFKRAASFATMALLMFIVGTGCKELPGNPFELVKTDFIFFLIPCLLAAVVVGQIWSKKSRGCAHQGELDSLNWAELAYLSGGANRLTSAAIARLGAAGAVQVSADGKSLEELYEFRAVEKLSMIEQQILKSLPLKRDDQAALKALNERVGLLYQEQKSDLHERGYLLTAGQRFQSALLAVFPIGIVVLALGIPRLMMGVSGHKPIGFLVATLAITGFISLIIMIAAASRRSNYGSACIKHAQRRIPKKIEDGTDVENVSQGVAVHGTSCISNCVMLMALSTWYPVQTTGDGGGCGSSGCGSGDGGGGCGGGCGGCGGGGCS